MPIIVEKVSVHRKSWFRFFSRSKFQIHLNDTELLIAPASEFINRVISSDSLLKIQVKDRNTTLRKHTRILPGTNKITLENDRFSCQLDIQFVENAWSFLDPNITTPGTYQGRSYYTNGKTLETSFDRRFLSEQSNFPSFTQHLSGDKLLFADSLNKIVIGMHPTAKQNEVKEALRSILLGHDFTAQCRTTRLTVDREHLLQSGAAVLLKSIKKLTTTMPVFSFKDEIGEDYGAIRRELFYLLTEALKEDRRLVCVAGVYDVSTSSSCPEFIYDDEYRVEAIEDVLRETESIEDDRVFYLFLGVLLGSIVFFRETIAVNFSLAFYENLLSRTFTVRHIQDVEYQRSILRCIRDPSMGYDNAELKSIIDDKLLKGRKNQYDFIRNGFLAVFPFSFKELTAFDFPFIFYHFEPISIVKLIRHVYYERCNQNTKEIRWLWEILSGKDQVYLSKFLLFFTGSGGFCRFDEEVKFCIEKINTRSPLFTASSCAKRLFVGNYDSKEDMEYYLDYSVLNAVGFHKV